MTVLLGLGVFLLGAGFFGRYAAQARQGAWAGPRSTGMRQRASNGGAQRPVRHEIKLAWEKVKADDWLKQRDHERKNGTGVSAETTAPAVTGTVLTPLQRAGQRASQRAGNLRQAFAPRPPAGGNGSTPAAPAAPARAAGAPRPAPSPAPPPGGTTVASNGNAVEQFVEGVNQIHAQAQAGGIHAKHAAIKACHEACVRFSSMAQMLSRQMSEPGMNYGNEITEPVGKAGVQLQASAMEFSEADAALTALENMTVGELAQSSRQAPHHTELSENGSR